MTQEKSNRTAIGWPVFMALGILILITLVFIYEFAISSEASGGTDDDALSAETYMDIVTPLLVDADAERGAALVESVGCNSCHAGANAGRLGPPHDQVARVAAARRPPLSAAAYIYESILYPGAFVVEGYQNNMPRIYEEQLSDADLGDMIAYLLAYGADDS